MRKAKPQTSDPLKNHTGNAKNGGNDAFALPAGSQDGYDTPFDHQNVGVPVRSHKTSNPINGSGGRCKTIAPHAVKGINR